MSEYSEAARGGADTPSLAAKVTMKTVSLHGTPDSSAMESVESLYMERNRYRYYFDSIPGFTCLLSQIGGVLSQ